MSKSARKKKKASGEAGANKSNSGPFRGPFNAAPTIKNPTHNTRYAKYYLAVSVSLITFLVYLRSFQNAFVGWDDREYIVENPHIRAIDLNFIRWAFSEFYAANWHPLTWISHALDYSAWGLNPLGHHLASNILHSVNTFIVVLLIVRLVELRRDSTMTEGATTFPDERRKLIAGGVTGLLFGLHPVHVESVAWVAERKDLLCALFFLLSIMVYINRTPPVESERVQDDPGPRFLNSRYLLAFGFFLLALLSKPMAVSLPAVLLLLDWYPLNSIRSMKSFWSRVFEKVPFLALSLGSSILTILAQKAWGTIATMEVLPLSARLLVAAKSLPAYLGKMLLPLNLSAYYPYPQNISFLAPEYVLSILLVAGTTILCFRAAGKNKLWLTAWGYYVITLVPVLGIVQVGSQEMADRYTYLSSLGPFFIIGLGVSWSAEKMDAFRRRAPYMKFLGAAAALLMLWSLSSLTLNQIKIWTNRFTLWDSVIEQYPETVPLAYYNRGTAFRDEGRLDKALEDYDKAIALNPAFYEGYNMRGLLLDGMGRPERALADYDKAIALNPVYFDPRYNRGNLYNKLGRFVEALADYNRALALDPSSYEAYNNRSVLFKRSGRFVEALADCDAAIALNPLHYEAYYNRGAIHLQVGNEALAASDFKKACELGDKKGCMALRAVQYSIKHQR